MDKQKKQHGESPEIHPGAVVDPGAELGPGVEVGPFCLIGPQVKIGAGTVVKSHTTIDGITEIGEKNIIGPYACLGEPPQDLKYKGEPTTMKIGDRNVIREFVTVHRGTATGRGATTVGSDCMLLVGVHIAHDCDIGNGVVIANATHLAGHVLVEENAVLGALIGVHQHVRIGAVAMVSAKAGVPMDIPPYTIAAMDRAKLYGLNRVGMERVGIPKETRAELRKAYRILLKSSLKLEEAVEKARKECAPSKELDHLIHFLENTVRGITR